MKKLLIVICCLAMLFVFASCDANVSNDLPTFEYNGRTIQYDLSTLKGEMDWDETQAYIDELNESNYEGHNDWRLFESEEEVRAWWKNGGKEAFDKKELSPVYILRSSVEYDDDYVYNWYCDDVEWVYESKGEYDAVIGCFAVRDR